MTDDQKRMVRATTRAPVRCFLSAKVVTFPDLDSPEEVEGHRAVVIRLSEPDSPFPLVVILEPDQARSLLDALAELSFPIRVD